MNIGDLIYCHHDDEYGILVEYLLNGWIVVAQGDITCEVQKCWWRKVG